MTKFVSREIAEDEKIRRTETVNEIKHMQEKNTL